MSIDRNPWNVNCNDMEFNVELWRQIPAVFANDWDQMWVLSTFVRERTSLGFWEVLKFIR